MTVWNFVPRRRVPELLVARDSEAVERAAAADRLWSQRLDGHRARQPRTISPEALAEARALRDSDGNTRPSS